MTDVAIASTALRGSSAGEDLAKQINAGLHGATPDALVVFVSPENDYGDVLRSLEAACRPKAMIGCSSAGEFTSRESGTGMSSAFALRNSDMLFTSGLARDLASGRGAAAAQLIAGFHGLESSAYRYRTALVFVDALAGHADDLVDELTLATGGAYQFVGGGAGDDGLFKKTHVFHGAEALTNGAVALEMLSNKPIGIGARHGWSTSSGPLRVTESADSCVVSLNVSPAIEAFEDHAAATHQTIDRDNPLPFFLHNVVGVKTHEGHKLRVPLGVGADGEVVFAAEVPAGATAQIMSTKIEAASSAAASAVADAVSQVERAGAMPAAALFFDCVATRLRLGQDFAQELDAVRGALHDAPFAGFNSYGQIVRADGQFSGFHNCTAVVCVFPD